MRKCLIYSWTCPETGEVVYVGKTSMSLAKRMANHIGVARRHPTTAKDAWLAALLKKGLRPIVEVLEETTVEASSEVERRWATLFRPNGTLLNAASVGAGNPGVGRVTWTHEALSLLGLWGDSRIARLLGCERKTVSYKRECLGIQAPYDRTESVPPPPMGGWNEIPLPDEIVALLGTQPDYVIAKCAGVSKHTIAKARIKRGIVDYASATGNSGKIKPGNPHPRWSKRRERQSASPDIAPAEFLPVEILNALHDVLPPPAKHGRVDVSDRAVLQTTLWVMATGAKWADVPGSAPASGMTAYKRVRNWSERGQWQHIERRLKELLPSPDQFDWSRAARTHYRRSISAERTRHETGLLDGIDRAKD